MKELLLNDAYKEYVAYISNRFKPTTVNWIKRNLEKHVLPILTNKNIYEINNSDFIKWQDYLVSLRYSNSFNSYIYSITKKFFDYLSSFYKIENYAEKFGRINSYYNVQSKTIQTWNLKEFKKFIEVVDDKVYHALFNFLFFTGVRKGELLALQFTDIKGGYANINKTLTKERFNGERLIMTPKSKKSNRSIRLDLRIRAELFFLQKYYTKLYGYFDEKFYVFGGKQPLSTTTLERKKNKYCELAGVKQIRIHDFRHSHATILYHKKIKIKYIQARLGHADISTTMNTYVHVDDRYEKRVYGTLNFLRLFF